MDRHSNEFVGRIQWPLPWSISFHLGFLFVLKFLSRFWFGNNFKKGEISVVSFIGIASLTCLSRGKQGGNKIWTSSRRRQIDYYQNTHTHTHTALWFVEIFHRHPHWGGLFYPRRFFPCWRIPIHLLVVCSRFFFVIVFLFSSDWKKGAIM